MNYDQNVAHIRTSLRIKLFAIAMTACVPAAADLKPSGLNNLPDDYKIEKVADKPQLPNALIKDDQYILYMTEELQVPDVDNLRSAWPGCSCDSVAGKQTLNQN